MSMSAFISMDARLFNIVRDSAIRKYEESKGNNTTRAGYNRVKQKVLNTYFKRYEAKVKELVTEYINERFPLLNGLAFSVKIKEEMFSDMPMVVIESLDWCYAMSNADYDIVHQNVYAFLHERTVYVNGNREWKMWEDKNAQETMEEIRTWKL